MSGQLVEQWPLKPLSEVCEIRPAKSEVKGKFESTEHVSFVPMKYLGIGQMTIDHSETREFGKVYPNYTYFADGDVLLAKITPCFENGKLGIAQNLVNGIGFGSSEFIVFRPNKDVCKEWIYYFLSQKKFRLEGERRMLGSVGQKRVSKDFIANYKIPVPPLEDQQRIVSILDEAFEKLAEKSQQIHSRLNGAEDLFGSYLSDLFSKKHQGWEETKVGEVVTLQGGSQPPKAVFSAEYLEGYIRLIQIRDYKSDKHIVYIPREKARRFCTKEDIMIGRYGPPLFQILRGIEGAYNVALMKAIPDEQYLTKDFLYYFLQNRDLLRYIERSSSRTAGQTGFKKETLESYTITYPKSKEQQLQLVEKLDTLKEKITNIIVNYEREIHMVEELKQSILQEAFNGTS